VSGGTRPQRRSPRHDYRRDSRRSTAECAVPACFSDTHEQTPATTVDAGVDAVVCLTGTRPVDAYDRQHANER